MNNRLYFPFYLHLIYIYIYIYIYLKNTKYIYIHTLKNVRKTPEEGRNFKKKACLFTKILL